MKEFKYKFTIFTACYNSAPFIHRVFKTLDSQTYRNFEWVVINDASSDNTSELIREYIKNVDFEVKFIDQKQNQMLAANYNRAAEVAEGEYFFLHDHDDEFIPTVLEDYARLIEKFDADNREDIGGLVGRCITQYGKVTPKEFTKPLMSFWEYGVNADGSYTGEAPRVIKTDVLRKYLPFDPEEKLNPPIEEIIACDGYKFITVNSVVRKYYVSENGTSLSYSIGKYPLWSYRKSLLNINKFQFFVNWSFKHKLSETRSYAYSAIKLGLPFRDAIKALNNLRAMTVIQYPLAWAMYIVSKNKFLHDTILFIKTGRKVPTNNL